MSAKLPKLAVKLVLAAQAGTDGVRLVGGSGLAALLDGLEDALVKDSGVDFAWLAWAARQVAIRPLPGLLVSLDLENLAHFRDRTVDALVDLAGANRTP